MIRQSKTQPEDEQKKNTYYPFLIVTVYHGGRGVRGGFRFHSGIEYLLVGRAPTPEGLFVGGCSKGKGLRAQGDGG